MSCYRFDVSYLVYSSVHVCLFWKVNLRWKWRVAQARLLGTTPPMTDSFICLIPFLVHTILVLNSPILFKLNRLRLSLLRWMHFNTNYVAMIQEHNPSIWIELSFRGLDIRKFGCSFVLSKSLLTWNSVDFGCTLIPWGSSSMYNRLLH